MQQSTNSKLQGLPIHGGNPQQDMERLGIEGQVTLDFSVNLSPLGIPDEIMRNWSKMIEAACAYPSLEGSSVVRFFTERFGIGSKNILAGNGSTEFIYLIPQALRLKKIAIVNPSFSDYTRAAFNAGADVIPLQLTADNGFTCPEYIEIRNALSKADALFIGNPNNPTGTVYPREILLQLAKEFPSKWIIVDQAFIQFLDNTDATTLIHHNEYKNILVILSLTKFYCLPGLRIGAVAGHESVIERLQGLKPPWSVNNVAEHCAAQLIHCKEYEYRLKQLINREKDRMYCILKTLKHMLFFKPSANFILGQWQKTENLDDLICFLLRQGIYIRDCRNFSGLEENYFRIAVLTTEENNLLVEALKKADFDVS
ncbi:MAG TPA: threonine-phosphate decarboxylase CobD [Thermodesulfovibrionia bacterium]|nr:threonine-phosphate decarboxylase CobD [Thermodesulfovibrionia bacterium]